MKRLVVGYGLGLSIIFAMNVMTNGGNATGWQIPVLMLALGLIVWSVAPRRI